jgi:acetyl-CoA C-acetyltransferase
MGDKNMVDLMIRDGLSDIFNDYHMGVTARKPGGKIWHHQRRTGFILYVIQNKPKCDE